MWLYNLGISLYAGGIRLAALLARKSPAVERRPTEIYSNVWRPPSVPSDRIVWVHAASLGEFEQARPIIERLRAEHPEYKILLTFFSPSGYEIRKNYEGADYVFYLPADTPSNARRFLDIVHPEIAIFIKYEFWINLLSELRRRKVRSYIVSAIFRRNSVFFRPYGAMWRQALETFDTLFVQNVESKRLLSEIGFDNVVVAGDTRFDRVAQIAAAAQRVETIERFRGGGRLFVAGSTWGPDEEILLPLVNANPDVKFVIAPHEMDEGRIAHLMRNAKGGAVRYTQCDAATRFDDVQVLVLDTMGMLSSVYGSATWAYVGGGFGVGIPIRSKQRPSACRSPSAPITANSRRRATWYRSAALCRCARPANWRRGSRRCATTRRRSVVPAARPRITPRATRALRASSCAAFSIHNGSARFPDGLSGQKSPLPQLLRQGVPCSNGTRFYR